MNRSEKIEEINGKIILASATFKIVKIPTVQVEKDK